VATVTNPGHPGWPPVLEDILDRVSRGLPVYYPTDPKLIDQTKYVQFAAKRGPNSE
jgi:hypothetical protein